MGMKVKISNLMLVGLWSVVPGVFAASADIGHSIRVTSLDRNASTTSTIVHDTSFSLDAFLEKPEITLTNGKTLMVHLDAVLKSRLVAEQQSPDASRKVTKAFVEYFERTKSSRVSDKVIGFYFLIDSTETIYRQTFLGENAK